MASAARLGPLRRDKGLRSSSTARHSFDGFADSICPRMNTPWGASPNPIPHKIVCANGEKSVPERVEQMLASMALGVAGGPTWTPPPEAPEVGSPPEELRGRGEEQRR